MKHKDIPDVVINNSRETGSNPVILSELWSNKFIGMFPIIKSDFFEITTGKCHNFK